MSARTLAPQNLLVIMSDEHSAKHLGCFGHCLVKTPHIDALAARGVRFEVSYTNTPNVPTQSPRRRGRAASAGS
jgi:choline-sulfatase